MKKYIYIFLALFIVVFIVFIVNSKKTSQNENPPMNEISNQEDMQEETTTSLANPASEYCEEMGGKLELVSNSDGSQIGLCKFEDYSCEEWAYLNGECTIEEDAQKVKEALIAKGLDLTDMKIVIKNHFGKYIGGSVLPISAPAGGGYVFAFKEDNDIKIVADGNGIIMCSMLEDYPDYPSYLISGCVDEAGNLIDR